MSDKHTTVFIPNNDVAPSRRLRIRKAMERGALWVREWRDGITHVIVDDGLKYNQVMSFLKIPSLPVRQTPKRDCDQGLTDHSLALPL